MSLCGRLALFAAGLDVANATERVKQWGRWLMFRMYVYPGNKIWFINCGIPPEQIYELDWWDDVDLLPEQLGISLSADDKETGRSSAVRVTCVPAQHNSGEYSTITSCNVGARSYPSIMWDI